MLTFVDNKTAVEFPSIVTRAKNHVVVVKDVDVAVERCSQVKAKWRSFGSYLTMYGNLLCVNKRLLEQVQQEQKHLQHLRKSVALAPLCYGIHLLGDSCFAEQELPTRVLMEIRIELELLGAPQPNGPNGELEWLVPRNLPKPTEQQIEKNRLHALRYIAPLYGATCVLPGPDEAVFWTKFWVLVFRAAGTDPDAPYTSVRVCVRNTWN